ncbi:box A-binding factor [Lucilia cuprina]|uniref:box A-binding factor n=1 Tax=Lucilia cuprina TaxID=7375 RepID=UPI001F0584C3|nr:box A-binding factor [Lucilia cuprina]
MSDSAETTQQKMDRRKKRTSTNQYMMYIEMMEKDAVFATGRIPREYDSNYLTRKWKELSDKLNNCSNGPTLTSEEWRKRLNDWKNTTRCKYRRSISGEKDITMTSLELRALELFGKVPATAPPEQISIHFKSEKEEEEEEMEHMPTTETFQKQLQAAVEEAIGDEDAEHMVETEHEEHEEIIPENTHTSSMTHGGSGGGGGGGSNHGNSISGGGGTTYRTIVVEEPAYPEDEQHEEQLEFITHRRSTLAPSNSSTAIQTAVVTTTPTATVTKLINGDIPLKRLRSQISDQIIYEVKKAPRYTVTHPHIQQHQSQTQHQQQQQQQQHHHQQQQQQQQHITHEIQTSSCSTLGGQLLASQDVREVARQLKRIADIKAEKLKFDIARFKFNNPGFTYNFNPS